MNGKEFSPLEQKGLKQEGNYVKTAPFYAEGKGIARNVRYVPKVREVRTIADYFALLKEVHENNKKRLKRNNKKYGSLFLYRGQSNVEWDYSPSIMRGNLDREHLLLKEFHRCFFEKLDNCKTIFDEEVIMQHYGAGSRCLDLLESPLMALWAAAGGNNPEENKDKFGEVSFWCLDNDSEELKAYDSSTVSVITSTAACDTEFSLGHVAIKYHKEHPTEIQNFIYLKDILRRSVLERPKYNNIHFTHQLNDFAVII